MPDGDQGQPGLQEANQDSLNNETYNNTDYLLHKNFECLLTQKQDAILKNSNKCFCQSILFCSAVNKHIPRDPVGCQGQGPTACLTIKTRTKDIIIKQMTKHPSNDESCDDDDDDDDDK